MSIYQFSAERLDGQVQSLQDFVGKVLLIVNTASHCGFTPQYAGLQQLYSKYKAQGLEILAFPCDQFADQEFAESTQIAEFCQLNYAIDFPIFAKVKVRGKQAHDIFQYLTTHSQGFLTNSIKWNFTKFLIQRDGQIYARYAPLTKPEDIEQDIIKLL